MDECTLKEYCDKDCESCTLAKENKDIAEAAAAIENIKNAIIAAITPICDLVIDFVNTFWGVIKLSNSNKKVVHLAAKAKKARTRKKNRNRILREFLKERKKGNER